MGLAVAILVFLWGELYFINVTLVETGTITQVNRNTILNKSIIDYSGIVAVLIVAGGVLYRAWDRSVPLLLQEISRSLRSSGNGRTADRKKGKGGGEVTETAAGGEGEGADASSGWSKLFSVVFKEVLLLGSLGECEDFQQWLGHFLIMWGFIGLAITTTLDAIVNFAALPLPIISPVRLLGNITGIMFTAGLTLSIARRALDPVVRSKSRAGDWSFLISLYGTAVSGFFVQSLANTGNVIGTWVSYPIHLSFIAFLLISAPWTKFIHALWRPSWIVESRLNSRSGG